MSLSVVKGIVSTDDLRAATGYESAGALRRALDKQGVRYFLGKDGAPWTTIDLLNAAKLPGLATPDPDRFSPEML